MLDLPAQLGPLRTMHAAATDQGSRKSACITALALSPAWGGGPRRGRECCFRVEARAPALSRASSTSSSPSCSARDEQPSVPAGCAAPGRRLNRPGVDRAARDHPGDHRVRVPHLAGPKLIASPDGSRDLRDYVEHAASTVLVGGQSARTVYGFGDVRNMSSAPKPDLVAKDPKSACPPTADRALGHDAPVLAAPVVDRRLLDDVRRPRKLHLERGVVEITRRTPLQARRDRLVHATIEPDEMSPGPQRQPVQVYGRRLTCRVAG